MSRIDRTKTIKFNMEKPEEKKLYEELQKLPHGKFSEETKEYWVKRLGLKEEGR